MTMTMYYPIRLGSRSCIGSGPLKHCYRDAIDLDAQQHMAMLLTSHVLVAIAVGGESQHVLLPSVRGP
jgi:hypothetical protein